MVKVEVAIQRRGKNCPQPCRGTTQPIKQTMTVARGQLDWTQPLGPMVQDHHREKAGGNGYGSHINHRKLWGNGREKFLDLAIEGKKLIAAHWTGDDSE